jgi:hypothetical protein
MVITTDMPEQECNKDGTLKHIVCEGARYHGLRWDSDGTHCSDPNCEINKWTREYNENTGDHNV